MSIKIKIKSSATPGRAPEITTLTLGELALNTYDGKLFFKQDNGTQQIIELATSSGSIASASYASYAANAGNATSASYATYASTAGSALTATSASYANNSTSASYAAIATSASYALTASYANTSTNAQTASYVNTLNQNVNINGNLVVHGTGSFDVFVTNYQSSSIIYSSGSTKFGDTLDDTHEFTGSVTITGSLYVNNSSVITSDITSSITVLSSSYAVTASYADNSTSASYATSASYSTNAATASNILGGKATHLPFFDTDTTLSSSAVYQSGSYSIIINQDNNTSANPEALYVWQPNPTSINVISGKGNLNNYLQLNINNNNQGTSASSDVVATANNGNETTNYIDMGINSENYAAGFVGDANDAYLYSTGRHLHIGNVSNYPVQIFAGGSDSDANKKLELNPNNLHQLTGSLDITADLIVQGGITGSLLGTASYADNALSSSYAVSASYAPNSGTSVSASYANNATSASYAISASYLIGGATIDSGSFATTGSNTFVGNQTITGSLNVTAGITGSLFGTSSYSDNALSSSYAYNADLLDGKDSTVFATTGSNTFKGNQTITTGSLKVLTPDPATNFTAIDFRNPDYGIYGKTNSINARGNTLEFTATDYNINGDVVTHEVLTLRPEGKVGIRTTDPSNTLEVNGGVTAISFTGSLQGTASLALDTQLFDGKDSTVFATTGSNTFIGNQTVTGSLITSGSNTLVGDTVLTGSLTVSGSTVQIGNNTLTGNTSLTGSITISGSQTFVGTNTITGSVNISGSTTQIGNNILLGNTTLTGSITVQGALRFDPSIDPGNISLTSSFLFTSASSTSTGYDLYYRQNGNLAKFKWLEGQLSTGLLYGGIVTWSGSVVTVSSGSGLVMDYNASLTQEISPIIDYITWNNITASITNITSSQTTYLYIDNNGNLNQQQNPFTSEQYQQYIPLGAVGHFDFQNVSAFGGAVHTTYAQQDQTNTFMDAFGPLKINGYILEGQENTLSLNIGSGTSFIHGGFYEQDQDAPSTLVSNSQITASIVRCYTSGSETVFDTNAGNYYTTIDPTQWDNNGVLDSVAGANWSIQRVFSYPPTNTLYIYYGQTEYTTFVNALQYLASDSFTEGLATQPFTVFVGYLVVKGNTTNITNTSQNDILQAGLYRSTVGGSIGGAAAATSLEDLTDVTVTSPSTGQALVYSAGTWINSIPLNATSASYATTASYVLNAVSASRAISSSYATTASYALSASYATTASYVLNAVSASYVLSASYSNNSTSASYSFNATSASYALSSSYALSASFANTIYNSDGTLVSNRTVTMNSYTLSFEKDLLINSLTIGRGSGSIATNTAIGYQVLFGNTTGTLNTALGYLALTSNTTGFGNTANGYQSLYANTTGFGNIGLGVYTLNTNIIGNSNTAIGYEALRYSTVSNQTAVGYQALKANTTGTVNVAIGYQSLLTNTTGANNSAFGRESLRTNISGFANTAVGNYTLYYNSIGSNNTALGFEALFNSTVSNQTAVGYQALKANTTGTSNTAIGYASLTANTTGYENTVIGHNAGLSNTTAAQNTFIGFEAGKLNTTGTLNTFVGANAGLNNTTGGYNSYLGRLAGFNNTTGGFNVAIGERAGRYISSGANATIIDNSILIGYDTRPLADNQTNQIVIGYNARGLGSNTTVLGNSSTTATAIYGDLLLGSTTDNGTDKLQVTGTTSLNGNTTITGSLTATGDIRTNGNIIAQQYIISSSVSYFTESFSSGSTKFGDTLDDTHQFTGSVSITGSLNINGSSAITSNQTSSMSVLSSSYALSSSYSFTSVSASYATYAATAGSVTTAQTASYATNFTIAGTLTLDQTLTDYATVASSIVGANNLFTQATGSYTSAFFKYTVSNGLNSRSGETMAVWNGTTTQFTDNSTLDIGDTSGVTVAASIVTSQLQFNITTSTSGWKIKSLATFM